MQMTLLLLLLLLLLKVTRVTVDKEMMYGEGRSSERWKLTEEVRSQLATGHSCLVSGSCQ